MQSRLQREIRQTKPFASLEEEAFLNLVRTANGQWQELATMLRQHRLTPTQYNALRILRGAGEAGLACSEVGERMVTPVPDVTRLLDRLEALDLVRRRRRPADRRVVEAGLTPAGEALVESLDIPVVEFCTRQLGHLGAGRLRRLIDLLETVREGSG